MKRLLLSLLLVLALSGTTFAQVGGGGGVSSLNTWCLDGSNNLTPCNSAWGVTFPVGGTSDGAFDINVSDANALRVHDGVNDVLNVNTASNLIGFSSGGNATAPTLHFIGDTDTGIYSNAANRIALTSGGTIVFATVAGDTSVQSVGASSSVSLKPNENEILTALDGFVGIGETTPVSKLHLTQTLTDASGTSLDTERLRITTTDNTKFQGIDFTNAANALFSGIYGSASSGVNRLYATGTYFWEIYANGQKVLNWDANEQATFTSRLDHASNNEDAVTINYTTNKVAGNDTGLTINQTDTASPGTSLLQDWQVGGSSKMAITNLGRTIMGNGVTYNLSETGGNASLQFGSTLVNQEFGYFLTSDVVTAAFVSFDSLGGDLTASSGVQSFVEIKPDISQTGTAGYNGLLVDVTETTTGSGNAYLMNLKVGGSSKLFFEHVGSGGGTTEELRMTDGTRTVSLQTHGTSGGSVGTLSNHNFTFFTNGSTRVTIESDRFNLSDGVILTRGANAGLTASTTQTQGQGAIVREINEVSTVANANDVVTLISAEAGMKIIIINNGANTLQIFPASGDNLGAGVDTSTTLAAGSNVEFVSYDATNWENI